MTLPIVDDPAGADEAAIVGERPDRTDELLENPPRGDHHLGRFAGYRAASPIRLRLGLALAACGAAMVIVFWQATRRFEAQYEREAHDRQHVVTLPEGTNTTDRSRVFHWTEGSARLGLRREAPGVEVIRLPDRDLVLAPGSDHAQVKLEVVDGVTTNVRVLVGQIEQRPRPPNLAATP